jgi:hypothetical protein
MARVRTEVEVEALGAQQPPRSARFLQARLAQVHVGPSGEAVLAVPNRFTVAQEHETVHA